MFYPQARRFIVPIFQVLSILLLTACLKPGPEAVNRRDSNPPTGNGNLPLNTELGAKLFAEQCASCHGLNGEGGIASKLNDQKSCLTCGSTESLVEKIASTMPPSNPQICDKDCATAIAAFMEEEFFSEKARCDETSTNPGQRALRMLTNREYLHTVRDLFQLGGDFSPVTFTPETRVLGFSTNHSQAVATERKLEDWLAAAEAVVTTSDLSAAAGCDLNQNKQCFLDSFATKIFRRPLSAEEKAKYADIAEQGGPSQALKAMLISPYFLYRFEIGEAAADGNYVLTPYEIATALSYMFVETTPDAELLALAANGKLSDAAVIKSQAERLLALPEAKRMTAQFAVEWLQVEKLSKSDSDSDVLTSQIKGDMLNETKAFFNHIAFESDSGRYSDLFSSEFTMANGRLADYYGLPHSTDADTFALTNYAGKRRGILGHGSILAATSHGDQTSPILRGLFVRDRILCQKLPDPPADADINIPEPNPNLSTRERFAQHNSDPSCKGCHRLIDPIGFGMESFDALGRQRDQENGKPIDTTGTLINLEELGASPAVEQTFSGASELSQIIAESNQAKQCFSLQFYRFSRGVSGNANDVCNANKVSQTSNGQQSIKDLMIQMTQASSFLLRR
ncbi:MAG: DUF1588 domain-containing protein [Pseudobacteriovorax sp.]|nr:DUF1588 domain-containing protein [Pseudobacteriovorax sp.]